MNDNADAARNAQALTAPRRVARPALPVQDAVILADVSNSMSERDGVRGERMPLRRIDRLAKVLDYLLLRVRVRSLICFSDLPVEVPLVGRVSLPEPAGSTNLSMALEHVASLVPRPAKVILISDGIPNSVGLALEAAQRLAPCIIDAYYVGPEGYDVAIRFMADLAAAGGTGGRSGHFTMLDPVLLGSELHRRLLLTGGR